MKISYNPKTAAVITAATAANDDILFDLKKKIDISKYDDYNKRVFGFISERLLNVYIEKNKDKLKIKELPVYNIEEPLFKQRLGIIKRKMLRFIGFN